MLVNDSLEVLSKFAQHFGTSTSRLDERLAYSALTTNKTMNDSVSLYHSSRNNVETPGAVNATTFAEAYKAMREQLSTDGLDYLNLAPKFLLCGTQKEIEARTFLTSIIPNQTSSVNVFQNSVDVIVSPLITGNNWYLVADPKLIEGVTLYRLEGQESPKVESRINWNTNSLELKCAYAVTAAPIEAKGLYFNQGN